MKDIYDDIQRKYKDLKELESSLEKSLNSKPEGRLVIRYPSKCPSFYCYFKEGSDKEGSGSHKEGSGSHKVGSGSHKEGSGAPNDCNASCKGGTQREEYLGKDKKDVVSSLAQKSYDGKLLRKVRQHRIALEKCLKILEKAGTDEVLLAVYNSMRDEVKPLIKTVDALNEEFTIEYVKKWESFRYIKKKVPNNLPFYTKRGEHVRSKSEVIIADRLYDEGIPYYYECPVSGEEMALILYPDFVVLNKRTRQEYCWEHFGMLDDPNYCADSMTKIAEYAKGGYIVGKNLIVTFECSKRALDTNLIDSTIKEYLK